MSRNHQPRWKARRVIGAPLLILAAHSAVLAGCRWLLTAFGLQDSLRGTLSQRTRRGLARAGTAVAALGVSVFLAGMQQLGFAKAMGQQGELQTHGIYQYTRNPLYVGVVLLYTGLGIALTRPHLLLGAVIWRTIFQYAATREAARLHRDFGTEFRVYEQAVPAFLPRWPR